MKTVIEMTRYGTQVARVEYYAKSPGKRRVVQVVGAPGYDGRYPNVPIAVQTLKDAGYRSSRKYEVADED